MSREVPVAATPFPVQLNETGAREEPAAGSVVVNETSPAGPSTSTNTNFFLS